VPPQGVCSRQYKLIRFYGEGLDSEEEWGFYDFEKDPHEMTNEYNNPEYKEQINLLKQDIARLR